MRRRWPTTRHRGTARCGSPSRSPTDPPRRLSRRRIPEPATRPTRVPVDPADLVAVERQLGRPPRGVAEVAHRCLCGEPDVVRTEPRLPDGTPFPTTYYLTCPRLTGAISTLETEGVMKEMTARLAEDGKLRAGLQRAHENTWRSGPSSARSPRSLACRRAGCRPGSSASTSLSRTRSPRARGQPAG